MVVDASCEEKEEDKTSGKFQMPIGLVGEWRHVGEGSVGFRFLFMLFNEQQRPESRSLWNSY